MPAQQNRRALPLTLLLGCLTWVATAAAGLLLLRSTWPAYAAAEPDKAYTLGMLIARLAVAAASSIIAGSLATVWAREDRRAAPCVGAVLLLISMPIHLFAAWSDYPTWYHAWYLLTVLPLTELGGWLSLRSRARLRRRLTSHVDPERGAPPA